MLPVLERVVDLRPGGWEATVERLIKDDRTSWIAVQVALTRPVGLPLKDAAVRRVTAAYRNLIAVLILREQIDQETVERLLDAPDMIVARDVAISVWQARRADLAGLPPTMLARWRDVIVRSPADDYWYPVILKSDPTLFADWLRARFFGMGDESRYEFLLPILEEPLRELPATVRADLIRAVPADVFSIFLQDVVTQLVGDDTTIAMVLLGREELKELHWAALRDGPSEAWMERALAALERGWEPKRIVASTIGGTSSWGGRSEPALAVEEALPKKGKLSTKQLSNGSSPRASSLARRLALQRRSSLVRLGVGFPGFQLALSATTFAIASSRMVRLALRGRS